jgi:NADH:ubiquinone oxidoreductase subunit
VKKILHSLPIISSVIHSTYSKSYTIIYDQFNEAIKIPQRWLEDIKHVEFNELLASSIGPLALFFNWKKRHKEEFSEIASGVLASSFVHGDPVGSITSIVVLAYRYDQSSNKQEMRNLKWGIIKGGASVSAFALTVKAMGVSLLSFLVGLCIAAVVRKTVSTLRFFEYLKFVRSLKVKIPKLKKKISRRDFISLKLFEFKKA